MNIAIIIPARYGSTRFPGKPLTKIGGKTMLSRVVDVAKQAIAQLDEENITLAVATEDQRIADHAAEIGVTGLLTSEDCATGSDRVLEALDKLANDNEAGIEYDFVISLQGDAPFTPPEAIEKMIKAFQDNPSLDVVTPVINLRWKELDKLREQKKTTPFSGTTAVLNNRGEAMWFSKNILPAIRKEKDLRENEFSPVYQHIGLYGYNVDVLREFVNMEQGHYEKLEGLEQLRLLENGSTIQTVKLEMPAGLAQSGIDSPEDVERAEKILKTQKK
jgi:3-deoxy-manno-octulosonate cytidylyltransferase (CMP-KDO synthetase)